MRQLLIGFLLFCAGPASAQLGLSLGNPEGCTKINTGESVEKEREMAIIAGHLNLYGNICMITAIQTNTLMATCPGEKDSRKKVFGITRTADGDGVTLTLDDGRIEELRPCN
ncbi:hypothetical protein [Roseovarius aestuariivivens]|uniref:hypothetical protein n=1 Tax=Roseovarius aestuariivivens TaxID=1888910 RepID=UPI0010814FDE|nr:hypothetical protein [Roseovarius aestuariivivens]